MDKQLETLTNIANNLRLMHCDMRALASKPLSIEDESDVMAFIENANLQQCQKLVSRMHARVKELALSMDDPRANLAEAVDFLGDAALNLNGAIAEQKVVA